MPNRLLEWIPVVFFLVVALVVASWIAWPTGADDKFAPLTANEVHFVTPGPFTVGQEVTITNGVCNTSDEPQSVMLALGFIEEGVDRLLARTVVVYPRAGETAVSPPMAPHNCAGQGEVTGHLPATLGPGVWRLYYSMTVEGKHGEIQKLTRVSEPIEVR